VVEARRFVVKGRVQGVGFRFYTEVAAVREGLSGFVRNLPDGGLETIVQGDSDAILRFERALRRGPTSARIDSVEAELLPPDERRVGFTIRS
jgi:acylphosphatase